MLTDEDRRYKAGKILEWYIEDKLHFRQLILSLETLEVIPAGVVNPHLEPVTDQDVEYFLEEFNHQ